MTGSHAHARGDVLRAYLVLPHAVPIMAVLVATMAFALVAAGGWPGAVNMVCLLGAMLGGQLAVGAVNELVDVELDRLSKPHKPIPAGLVSHRGARAIVLVGLLLMVAFSVRFSIEAFVLCALGNGTGIAYSIWFKRTVWSWIPYIVAVPLIPIWVWTALDDVPIRMLAIYPLAVPAVIALQLAQSMPDIGLDREAGVRTLAVELGSQWAPRVAWTCVLLPLAIAASAAAWVAERPEWIWVSCLISGALLASNVVIWRRNPHQGVMSAFPLIAAAVVVLGVGWSVGIVSL
ncbi:MAG TPA: UbiA family prenyltransferase [Thermomicrobiales bacterium]|nr:UbiA family prenyltransferase [Thermomicrobiales bacterium]